ncbi:MAG: hypothetical protein JXB62_01625 [Pirellulales bacterium]|nr:hypothetical protein [Pirellulales bacterium]
MKRCTLSVGCCLLALAVLAGRPAFATTTLLQDADQSGSPQEDSERDEAQKQQQKQPHEEQAGKKQADKQQSEQQPATAEGSEKQDAPKEEPKKDAAPTDAPAKPATVKAQQEPFKIEVSLDGAFEAQKATELTLKPEVWTSFKVLKTVEHGTRVKQGDLLVALDTEDIDRAIKDLRTDQQMSDLDLKLAEQQLAMMEKTTPMDLEAAERGHKIVHEDQDYYLKVSRPLSLKSAEFMLKSSQEYLEYQEEELRQLEKMYQADELTEETEEIILKRARSDVEYARFYLEQDKLLYDRLLKVVIPRRDVSQKESTQRSDLAYQDGKVTMPVALKRQRLAVQKLQVARERSAERLEKLLADRGAMNVKAPVGGIVYHGKFSRGKLSSSNSGSSGIRPGGSLSANSIFMTIVKTRPMIIRATVAEAELHKVRAGIQGTAVPTGFPEMKLTAIVDQVGAVPMSAGSFDSRITVALDGDAEALVPGMTCKLTLTAYENKKAVTIPPKALEADETDRHKQFVYVLDKKGKPKKRPVTVGRRTNEKVEILKGLAAGDEILAEPPGKDDDAKKSDAGKKNGSAKKNGAAKKDEAAKKES